MFSLSSMMPAGSLTELSESVRRSLNSVQVQIVAAWNAQHADDGSHGDVTAIRVRSQAFGGTRIYRHTVTTLANDVIEIPSGVSFVEIYTPLSIGSRFTLRGIRQLGVQDGDMLWLRTSPNSSYATTIRRHSHTLEGVAPINTELVFPERQASAADNNFFVMTTTAGESGAGRALWVPFIYGQLVTDRFAWLMAMTMSGA
jgi:hypothetical protein